MCPLGPEDHWRGGDVVVVTVMRRQPCGFEVITEKVIGRWATRWGLRIFA